jgi:glycosyltransferase involved in cell wall biosynthesis
MTATRPEISIVMPAYNAEKYVARAIESVLKQTFKSFEFIIIDDGSTDKTHGITQLYAQKDSRAIVVTHKKNKGLVNSLNEGLRMARGKYIARMDADDISLPDRLLRQYQYLEKNPSVVLVGTSAAVVDDDDNAFEVKPRLLADHEIRIGLAFRCRFCHGSVMIRRDVIASNSEFYNPNALHHEDYEYWPRLLKYGLAANLPEVLYYWRQSSSSITSVKQLAMRTGSQRVSNRETERLRLHAFRLSDTLMALKVAKTYKPSSIIFNGKELPTHLQTEYQYYLYELSTLYFKRKDYASCVVSLATSFLINPISYVKTLVKLGSSAFKKSAR